jgi:hypothetical protein
MELFLFCTNSSAFLLVFLILAFIFLFVLMCIANYCKFSIYKSLSSTSRIVRVFMNIFNCDGLPGPLTSISLLSFVVSIPISPPCGTCCSRGKVDFLEIGRMHSLSKKKKKLELVLEYVGKE